MKQSIILRMNNLMVPLSLRLESESHLSSMNILEPMWSHGRCFAGADLIKVPSSRSHDWKVQTELELDYTKFTMADESQIPKFWNGCHLHQRLLGRDYCNRVDFDWCGPISLITAILCVFNSPNLKLVHMGSGRVICSMLKRIKLVIVRNNQGSPEKFSYGPTLSSAPIINEGKWGGTSGSFNNNAAISLIKSPNIMEFYFEHVGSKQKVKFSLGNPQSPALKPIILSLCWKMTAQDGLFF